MSSTKNILINPCIPGFVGEALALELASRPNTHIFAGAKTSSDLSRFSSSSSKTITPLPFDPTSSSSSSTSSAVDLVAQNGGLDVLITCPAAGSFGPILDMPLPELQEAWTENVVSVVATTQAFVPLIVRKRRGRIVNLGSIAGEVALAWSEPFGMTKAAIASFTRTLRCEVAPFGVRVTFVHWGAVANWNHLHADLERALPSTSLYRGVVGEINKAIGNEAINTVSADLGRAMRALADEVLKDPGRARDELGDLDDGCVGADGVV